MTILSRIFIGWFYHVTKRCARRGPLAALVVTHSTHDYVESKNRGNASTRFIFIRSRSAILLIFSYGILLQIFSIILWVTLLLGVAYNTCGV